jgi:uncharacterized protein
MINELTAVTLKTCHKISNNSTPFILMAQENESIFTTLQHCITIMKLQSALVAGIGSIKQIELGFYDHDAMVMHKKKFTGIYEIASLSGSVTYYENEPFVHLHGAFSDADYQTFGGHMIDAQAGAATELYITPLSGKVARVFDQHMKIKRIHCP